MSGQRRQNKSKGWRVRWGAALFFVLLMAAGCGEKDKKPAMVADLPVIKVEMRTPLKFANEIVTAPIIVKKAEEAGTGKAKEPESGAADRKVEGLLPSQYRSDKDYMALERHEYPGAEPERPKPPEPPSVGGRFNTISKADKNLVLGGKGLDIDQFDERGREGLVFDIGYYLEPKNPPPPADDKPERLDPKTREVHSNKALVFHGDPIGFFKPVELESSTVTEPTPPAAPTPPKMEKIPQTKTLISGESDDLLLLQPGGQKIDLLHGGEKLNRRLFDKEK